MYEYIYLTEHIDTFSNKRGATLYMVAVDRIAPILPIMIDVMVAMRTVCTCAVHDVS